jgi:hypothetical protein
MADAPPPHIAAAAAQVERWLAEQNPTPKSADEVARMTPRDRINYCRQFDQAKMPAWDDPGRVKNG